MQQLWDNIPPPNKKILLAQNICRRQNSHQGAKITPAIRLLVLVGVPRAFPNKTCLPYSPRSVLNLYVLKINLLVVCIGCREAAFIRRWSWMGLPNPEQ